MLHIPAGGGASKVTTVVTLAGPKSIAADGATNKIYVQDTYGIIKEVDMMPSIPCR